MTAIKSQGMSKSGLQYIRTSIIFSLCFWAMEAVQDVVTFDRGTFINRLLFPDAKALWMRVLVICVILLFGVVADSLKDRKKEYQWRAILRSEWGIFCIGLVFSAVYWFIESIRYTYIYGSGNFLEMVFAPAAHILWVRLMAVFFLVLFALCQRTATGGTGASD